MIYRFKKNKLSENDMYILSKKEYDRGVKTNNIKSNRK